jgi:hypothetical protein
MVSRKIIICLRHNPIIKAFIQLYTKPLIYIDDFVSFIVRKTIRIYKSGK